jgi:hypothetical protein
VGSSIVCRTCLGFGNNSGADDLDVPLITTDETDSEFSNKDTYLFSFSRILLIPLFF